MLLAKIDRKLLRSKELSLTKDFLEKVNTSWPRNRHGLKAEKLEMLIRNNCWRLEEKECTARTDLVLYS